MSTAIQTHDPHTQKRQENTHIPQTHTQNQHNVCTIEFSNDKLDLLKQTICKGATDDELEIFVHACKRTGLDPFMKQIHSVKRWDPKLNREVMTIQTGIDGYRLIAERTGKYMPGQQPELIYDAAGKVVSATAYVKKLGPDGQWHTIAATAFYEEYVQTKKDGKPMGMWEKMPRSQLSKCAESLALRKSFPADLSGVYTKEEMEQGMSESIDITPKQQQGKQQAIPRISIQQAGIIDDLIAEDAPFRQHIITLLKKNGIGSIPEIPLAWYKRVYDMCFENSKKRELAQSTTITSEDDKEPSVFDKE